MGPEVGHGGRAPVDVHRGQEVRVAELVVAVAQEEEVEQTVAVIVSDRHGGGTRVVIKFLVRGRHVDLEEGRGAHVGRIEVPDEPKLGPGVGAGHREFPGDVQADEVRIAVAGEVARGALVDPAAHAVGGADDEVRPQGRQRDRPGGPAGDRAQREILIGDVIEVLSEGPRVLGAGLGRLRPEARHDDGRGDGDAEDGENIKAPLAIQAFVLHGLAPFSGS